MAHQRSGQALVEYVVLLALGSVVAIGTMTLAGPQLSAAFAQLTAAVANPMEVLASPAPTPTHMPSVVAPSGPITDSAPEAPPAPTATAPAPTPNPAAAPTPRPVVHPTPAPTPAEHDEGKHKGQQGG